MDGIEIIAALNFRLQLMTDGTVIMLLVTVGIWLSSQREWKHRSADVLSDGAAGRHNPRRSAELVHELEQIAADGHQLVITHFPGRGDWRVALGETHVEGQTLEQTLRKLRRARFKS